jgi:formylglycine-generating enzyme required for sulfatase activity
MLGAERSSLVFGWDNEQPSCVADVAGFQIQRHDVTNARYLEFVDAGGYADARWWRPEDWQWAQNERLSHPLFWERVDGRWFWRGMFELIPLPPSWPVYVSQARWRGWRLPTEAEYQRAAAGAAPGLCDFASWDPEPVGSHPDGASEFGVDDLVGNGWEWTSSPFRPFPGFHASASYPEYSADFFDGEHFVMKGASPATARELVRPTFRNWFRARYPYVYAAFRCVRSSTEGVR